MRVVVRPLSCGYLLPLTSLGNGKSGKKKCIATIPTFSVKIFLSQTCSGKPKEEPDG